MLVACPNVSAADQW